MRKIQKTLIFKLPSRTSGVRGVVFEVILKTRSTCFIGQITLCYCLVFLSVFQVVVMLRIRTYSCWQCIVFCRLSLESIHCVYTDIKHSCSFFKHYVTVVTSHAENVFVKVGPHLHSTIIFLNFVSDYFP